MTAHAHHFSLENTVLNDFYPSPPTVSYNEEQALRDKWRGTYEDELLKAIARLTIAEFGNSYSKDGKYIQPMTLHVPKIERDGNLIKVQYKKRTDDILSPKILDLVAYMPVPNWDKLQEMMDDLGRCYEDTTP